MARLTAIEAAAKIRELERLTEHLQARKVRLQRRLWTVSIDREVTEINKHLALVDARMVVLRAAGAMALEEVRA